MNRLDKILHDWVEENYSSINADTEGSEERASELKLHIEDTLRKQIISEVTEEKIAEIVATADEQIKKAARIKKIKEIKDLVMSGFIIAFFVGLLVNQVTEIATFLKESYGFSSIRYTVFLSIVLASICVLLYAISFIKNALELINENEQKE